VGTSYLLTIETAVKVSENDSQDAQLARIDFEKKATEKDWSKKLSRNPVIGKSVSRPPSNDDNSTSLPESVQALT